MSKSAVRSAVSENTADLLRYFVRRVSLPEDAADLLGESLLVVWKRADALPADPTEARMWMFGIARNVLLAQNRDIARQARLRERLRENFAPVAVEPQAVAESRVEVEIALRSLTAEQKELVLLVHGEGFTVADAGSILQINASTARSRYSAALALMRDAIAEPIASPRGSG